MSGLENTVEKMPESISKSTAKLLKDVTGEPELDLAMKATLKDALEYRLEGVLKEIEKFEDKHDMKFEEFETSWEKDEIKNKYSYELESDLWKWEELTTRREKIQTALKLL